MRQFRRKRDNAPAEAKQWFRHGDHPAVTPATEDILPNVQSPSRFGALDSPSGRTAVFAGDWIVTLLDTGLTICLPERIFRQAYEPVAS